MKKDFSLFRYLVLVTHIGWLMALSILCGFGIGYFIYSKTDAIIWLILFIIVGIIAGFYNVYKLIYKSLEKDAEDYNFQK